MGGSPGRRAAAMGTMNQGSDENLEEDNAEKDALLKAVQPRDLIQFGLIPEFVGRFPTLVPFHSLDKTALVRILTEPRNSLIAQKKALFKFDKVCLVLFSLFKLHA